MGAYTLVRYTSGVIPGSLTWRVIVLLLGARIIWFIFDWREFWMAIATPPLRVILLRLICSRAWDSISGLFLYFAFIFFVFRLR